MIRVLSLSLDALRVAMLVVAEAPCDVQFAPAPTAKMRGEYTVREGSNKEESVQVGIKVSYSPRHEHIDVADRPSSCFEVSTTVMTMTNVI